MKAVILASGVGSRFRPFTESTPKQLIPIGKETILGRILKSLKENNIKDVLITTGHLEEMIKKFTKENGEDLNFEYIYNPRYKDTNYIYSLWLAKEKLLGNDIILLHGDLVYDFPLLKMVKDSEKSVVTVNKELPVPEKDFKARIKDGKIAEIGVNVFGEGCFTCMPMYKVLKDDLAAWFKQIDKFVAEENIKCYAENALNEITDKINLYPFYYTTEINMEIDNAEDLVKAEKLLGVTSQ